MKQHNEELATCQRPLVGNSVMRVWRHNRHPHTFSRTQSDFWDATPTPGPTAGASGSLFGLSSQDFDGDGVAEADIQPPALQTEQAIDSSDSEGDIPEDDSEEEKDEDVVEGKSS